MKVLPIFGALIAVTLAVPTPDRIRTLFPERTDLLDQVSSFGRLLAQDAHRVYKKSFGGLEVNDLDAMLDQLFDGQDRLWEVLDRFSDDEDSEEDDSREDVFTELISQLDVDPDSMSLLLSGGDRLEVDGKRMECMMDLLDKLSKKITDLLDSLDGDRESFMWTWIKRHLKSSLEGMLRVIDSIKSAIEDAEREVAIDEELEIPDEVSDEDESEDMEIQHGVVDLEEDGDVLDGFGIDPTLDLGETRRFKRSAGLRGTVTAASRFQNGFRFRVRGKPTVPIRSDFGDYSNTPLGGGWSVGAAGLMWKNPKNRGHRGAY